MTDSASPAPVAAAAPLRRNRNFRWLITGETISKLGDQFSGMALPVLAVTALGATEWQMGFLSAAGSAAFLLFGLIAGAWVDRWVKRRVMIWADLIRFASLATIPLLWFAGVLQIWHVVVVAFVIGVATVFFDVAYQSFVPVLFPGDQIGQANSALETTAQVTHVGGPSVTGFLLALVKAPTLILLDAISFLFSVGALLRIRDDETPAPKNERQPLHREIAEGLRFVWNQKLILTIACTTASSNLFSSIGNGLIALFVLRDLGLTPAAWGIVGSIAAVGGLLGAASTGRLIKWIGEGPLIAVSAVIMALAFLPIVLSGYVGPFWAPVLLCLGEFFVAFTVLTYNITQVTARQRLCPPKLLGRMNASIRFFVWGVMPIGALLAGWLGSMWGIQTTMWIAFYGGLASVSFVVFSPLARMRQLPTGE